MNSDVHVPVADGLVTDDGHEWREHENDEACRHRRADGGEDYSEHESQHEHGHGHMTVSTVAVAPMCASWPV